MRVMVIVKASKESEAGQMPTEEMFAKMGRYNEELVQAGIVLGMDGLQPSSKGKRVRFAANGLSILDGPFAETKELVGGYWIWRVSSMDEALTWLKKAPFEPGAEVEVRPLVSLDDLGETFTPELRAQEERQIAEIKKQQGKS